MNNSLQKEQNEAARQPLLPGLWATRFVWLWLVFLFAIPTWGATPQKVTLQLKWHHQFQFAGYYAAQIKGFYQANGLEVTLQEAGPTQMPLPTVEAGKAEFGVSDMEVFQAYLEGKPLVALGVVFQHSPNVILALRKSGIHRPADLVGRKVMFQGGQGLVETRAMLEAEGLRLDQVQQVPHSWNLDDLLQGRIDGLSAYSTNEPFLLKARGAELVELRPIEYGVDFYGDLLFTTRRFAEQNPALVEAFRKASFQGWEYAMEHPEEIIQHILTLPGVATRSDAPEKLRFEAARMKELILPGLVDAGHMNPGRFQRIAQTAMKQGFVKTIRDPEGFCLNPLCLRPRLCFAP
ncbi:MAG: ABC transporter substrate-binding protein [Holophaga sp.]|nr:ABC transporter substrate-binding protein [Holophaga sp.]